ncbi:MAG: hypothetical protein FWF44_04365, partial [Defluviitaleaceae bacterium]|nr:hypothetical protein [Defluviitaleaceae bacterium]
RIFEELGRAVEFARADAVEVARNEAVSRGAKGEITVTCSISDNDAEIRGGTVRLGTTVSAQAVGAAGF